MKFSIFNDSISSRDISDSVEFRIALLKDVPQIAMIEAERDSSLTVDQAKVKIKKELDKIDDEHQVFVAVEGEEILGYCRFFHSHKIKPNRVIVSSPEGFYNMGITVKGNWQRQNIGSFLSLKRFEWLKNIGVKKVYSGVSRLNKASIRFHKSLGFVEVGVVSGFLHVSFDCGHGYLFVKKL